MTGLAGRLGWSAFTAWHARGERALPFRPIEEIKRIQTRRVRAMIRHAWEKVPFYRRAMEERSLRSEDIRDAEYLAKLPLIDGRLLTDASESLMPKRAGTTVRLESSGTSGRSKYIDYDAAGLFLALAHGQRQRAVIGHFTGKGGGYRELLIARPRAMTNQIRHFYEAHFRTPPGVDLRRKTIAIEGRIEAQIAGMNAFRPRVLLGYGSYLGAFLRRAVECGLDVWRPKVIVYGADGMDDSDRAWIERDFGVPVLSFFNARRGWGCTCTWIASRYAWCATTAARPGRVNRATS